MIGGIVSSFTTFIALRTNALQSNNWLNGNFAVITSGRYEILYLAIPFINYRLYICQSLYDCWNGQKILVII